MANGNDPDRINLKAIYKMLFSVPDQGMNIESLIDMVGGQSSKYLLGSLGKDSDLILLSKTLPMLLMILARQLCIAQLS